MKNIAVRLNESGAVKSTLLAAFGLLFWMISGLAQAVPITFTIDKVDVAFSNQTGVCLLGGCTPVVNPVTTPFDFQLESVGDTTLPFDLFSVDISGWGVGQADVLTTISFSSPSSTSTSGGGTGFFSSRFNIFNAGNNSSIDFSSQPTNLIFSDGTEISLALAGGSGQCKGFKCSVNVGVQATSTLQSVPVPEPGTLALFGAGLLGFGMMRRRRLIK